jgi:hypothetical protein
MEYFNALMKQEKQHEMVLFVVLVFYIMFDISTPAMIAEHVDSVYGNIIVAVLALSLFLSTHPVIGILGLFAAYELIKRSKHNASGPSSINALIHQVAPGESYRSKYMEATQVTYNSGLEEALVGQVPALSSQPPANYRDANSNFQPVYADDHSAVSAF